MGPTLPFRLPPPSAFSGHASHRASFTLTKKTASEMPEIRYQEGKNKRDASKEICEKGQNTTTTIEGAPLNKTDRSRPRREEKEERREKEGYKTAMEQVCCEQGHVQASSLCPAEKKRSSNGSAQPNSAKRRRLETGPDPAEQSRTAGTERAATRHEERGKEKTRADGAGDDDDSVSPAKAPPSGPRIPFTREPHRFDHATSPRDGQPHWTTPPLPSGPVRPNVGCHVAPVRGRLRGAHEGAGDRGVDG